MKNIRPTLAILATATVALTQATAWADSAADIQGYAANTAATFDDNGTGNYPVVSAILSAPNAVAVDGYTYTSWAYFAQDTTASLDIFYKSSLIPGYTPTVGDNILVQGTYSPFDGIPELETGTAQAIHVTYGGGGNSLYFAQPAVTTIPTINVGFTGPAGTGLNASGLAGQLLQLNNVTISGAGANWATHANVTATITDPSNNSMVMYLWASSYSTCAAIANGGGAVPTGPVDMTGFVDDFYNTSTLTSEAEFVPTSITALSVPEPTTLGLIGLGLAGVCYRLRKKA
jgi:hypothetical protein